MAVPIPLAVVAALLAATPATSAEAWKAPDSPFMPGEAYAEVPATCETVADWIDKAPETDSRVTMSVLGDLVAVEWDGALAYLVMCPESGVQIMCVTYSKDGRNVGDTVLFAGGYNRVGERQIMLDPCLASPEG